MPDWLHQSFGAGSQVALGPLCLRLGLALVLGIVVAGLYHWTRRSEPVTRTFPPTLVLLAILIAMVTQVIGDNVARAFSLVGALSIVRFRTVVHDTQDTAFVILAVVVGMAVGADHLWVALAGISMVSIAAWLMRLRGARKGWVDEECFLALRIGLGQNPETLLGKVLDQYLARREVMAVATARKAVAVDFNYRVRLRPGAAPSDLVAELNRTEGVQSVQLHRHGFDQD